MRPGPVGARLDHLHCNATLPMLDATQSHYHKQTHKLTNNHQGELEASFDGLSKDLIGQVGIAYK